MHEIFGCTMQIYWNLICKLKTEEMKVSNVSSLVLIFLFDFQKCIVLKTEIRAIKHRSREYGFST